MPASDILSAADMVEYRSLYEDLAMPDSFLVERDTSVSDDAGGSTTTTANVANGPCRLRAVGQGTERMIADRRGWQTPYAVDLHPGVDLRQSDRLVVNGRSFEVGGIVEVGEWSVVQSAVVQEVG